MKREEQLTVVVILIVLIYATYQYKYKKEPLEIKVVNNYKDSFKKYKEQNLTQDVVVNYIVDVINNGSNRLNFQKEGMEGGYIPKDKARDVACYVYELSGKKCKQPYAKDASLYFSSNCAGCHGNDGKGLNGAFPDLTRKRLLGLTVKN